MCYTPMLLFRFVMRGCICLRTTLQKPYASLCPEGVTYILRHKELVAARRAKCFTDLATMCEELSSQRTPFFYSLIVFFICSGARMDLNQFER